MSTNEPTTTEQKVSVYIALGGAIMIASIDLIQHGSVAASQPVLIPLIGFAGGRQLLKSLLRK